MDENFYTAMLTSVLNATTSSMVVVNGSGIIAHIYQSKASLHKTQHFLGHAFCRLLHMIVTPGNADTIFTAYQTCRTTHQPIQIPKLEHTTKCGLAKYISCHFSCIPEDSPDSSVIICFRDITESILMEEEFFSISEQYESVNRELCIAVSNLDFHLMDIEQAHKKIAALYQITSIVQKTVDEQEVLNDILNGIARELDFMNVSILLYDDEKQELKVKAYRGRNSTVQAALGEGIAGLAALKRELIYVDNLQQDSKFSEDIAMGEVAIPLIIDDKLFGVLLIEITNGRILQSYDLDLLRSLASQIAMTIAHANHVMTMKTEASTDGLTGLYNYRHFINVLQQEFKRALRYTRPLALLMIDIDFFKHYNDTNGHVAGDHTLQTVATLIKESCRDVDIVVRYGGEEFAVILPETTVQEANDIAERVRKNVAGYPFPNGNLQPNGRLTISVGISGFPDAIHSYSELVEFADTALYGAKRASRNCTCLYTPEIKQNK
ncbi:MAG: sensor domain-containing diguanylate cyclase [Pelosinus sp.]|nr:sensor domain-containing diguanylate cyclase [Pelosinus sp.]